MKLLIWMFLLLVINLASEHSLKNYLLLRMLRMTMSEKFMMVAEFHFKEASIELVRPLMVFLLLSVKLKPMVFLMSISVNKRSERSLCLRYNVKEFDCYLCLRTPVTYVPGLYTFPLLGER